jgi:hypothetical protein
MKKMPFWRLSASGSLRRRFSSGGVPVVVASWLVLLVAPGVLYGEEGFGGFEESASNNPNNPTTLVVGTENPDALTVGTEDPASMTVGTTALPGAVGTEALNVEAGTGADPSSLTVGTERLTDSPSGPGFYGSSGEQGKLPNLVPASPRTLGEAQAILARAQSRLTVANTAVGDMVRRDYPTGNARLLLYDEQTSAQKEVGEAEHWVEEFGG